MQQTLAQRRVAHGMEIRARLVDAACRLMAQDGYQACAIADIAAAAAATKNQLLHYFRSKEQLGLAVVERLAKAWRDEVLSPAALYPAPEERLRHLLGLQRELGTAGWVFDRLLLALALEAAALPPALREAVAAVASEIRRAISTPLKELREGGKALPAERPRAVATAVLGAVLGAAALRDLGEGFDAASSASALLERGLLGG